MNEIVKIEIMVRPDSLETLKVAMNSIGIQGMTVTHVQGYGNQKGITHMYRGVEYEVNLLPKVKIEMVVEQKVVDEIVGTAKEVLATGKIGDGKIFIYPVSNVIKIRTGEEGINAL